MKESELQSAIGSLPRSIRPQRDLWPGIKDRLETVEKDGQRTLQDTIRAHTGHGRCGTAGFG